MNVLSKSSVTQSLQFVLTSTLILLFISLGNAQYLSSNNCGSNQEVDVYMQGVLGQSSPSIYIGSVSTATKLFVNVWIEANDCSGSFPSSITITNGSQSFNVGQTSVTQSTGSNVLEKLYRATINNPTSTTVSVSGMGSCTSTSISVQKVRTGTGRASYIKTINKEFDETNSTYTMNIGSATIARNISILVPIHEKANDDTHTHTDTDTHTRARAHTDKQTDRPTHGPTRLTLHPRQGASWRTSTARLVLHPIRR